MKISGAVVLITGASSGIGAATARRAAARGARVVLVARRQDRIEALASELDDALAVQADVTDPEQLRAAVDATVHRHGRLDVLVNNAGQGLHQRLDDVAAADFRAVLELNVVAPLVAMQAVLPIMRAQGAGSIVNVSSGTSRMVLSGVGAYAASKSALNMLSAVARSEWADEGITVSTLYPFVTSTEFHESLRAGSVVTQRSGAPVVQPDTPEQVADVLLELVESGAPEAVLVPEGFGSAR